MPKKWCFIFLLILFSYHLFAQDSLYKRMSVGVRARYGFIIPHRASLVYLIQNHINAWDVTCSWRTKGNMPWHTFYRIPELGIGIYHANLGNPQYLGSSDAAFGFIRIPFYPLKKRFNIAYSIGSGIAFLSNHFNKVNNIYNIAIGSQANVYIDFGLSAELNFTKKIILASGFQFTHYSNGAWRKPNLGFNIPSATLGLKYTFNKMDESVKLNIEELKTVFKRKNEFGVTFSEGVRENPPPDGKKFYASAICIKAERIVTFRRKFGTGLDIFYDPSLKPRIISDSIEFKTIYNFRSGLHLSHDLVFNKVSITMQTGVYFFTKAKDDGLIYSRVGLRAKVYKNLTASLTLKTHFFKADVIEWGVGYCFEK